MNTEYMLEKIGQAHYWIELFYIPLHNTLETRACIIRVKKLDDPDIVFEACDPNLYNAVSNVYEQFMLRKED